ncbi:leucyl aminopeptidase [Spongiibacter sp. KMU-158]|uniref:Probable cytosol aminopeptidase n=1 Tax=Spongiibacter pelagi TaxID=2760804 RepID=A0A927C1P5_9GAMM|nr:leucyl aminopeptidase [Spongiibacter pelagi]MBD2858171.1 leucyl aminopeptidase [Spongiibacter pelagi]
MQISLKPAKNAAALTTDLLAVCLAEGPLNAELQALDTAIGGTISRLISRKEFTGKAKESLYLPEVQGLKAKRVLLLGIGDAEKALSIAEFDSLLAASADCASKSNSKSMSLLSESLKVEGLSNADMLQRAAKVLEVGQYRYTTTLSKPKPASSLKSVTLQAANSAANQQAVARGQAIALGITTARQLGNLPANICNPDFLAKEAKKLGRKSPQLSVSVLDEKKMLELGMGALLSVTAGTEQPARLIVMEYKGGAKNTAPHVLVGKGITFDTGGISIKPSGKMEEMKFDMCGAASVLGTMNAVVEMALPINVVGIVAAAENMPSGKATKPGDVVTSMSGQTIEVVNTDAEGRLVLCDALTYAAKFKPASIIDIATLTGACVVALGNHASGLYSNQDDFAQELLAAGVRSWDRAWQMPLWNDYQQQLDTSYADICNVGGPAGGSVTAACFLSRFAKDQRWAHLDIAGTAWTSHAKGATGRPVGLLCEYLISKTA